MPFRKSLVTLDFPTHPPSDSIVRCLIAKLESTSQRGLASWHSTPLMLFQYASRLRVRGSAHGHVPARE